MPKIWTFGSDVDTDQIVPGRYAPFMLKAGDDVMNYAFVDANPDFNRHGRAGDILVAADNFGCGSSREYAPVALKKRKIGAIIANSFARIFYRNAINLGIPVFVAPEVVAAARDGMDAALDLDHGRLTMNHVTYTLPPLPDFARAIIAAGGIVRYVREHGRFPGQAQG